MKKILFLIHDLGPGGAEKVLVELVNGMDRKKWQITVMALFGGGVNGKHLHPDVRLICCHKRPLRGNSHIMKLFSPRRLYRHYIREEYDVAVSFLEGPCARILSGCDCAKTALGVWIHGTLSHRRQFCRGFRSFSEAAAAYRRFHRRIFVSPGVRDAFAAHCPGDGVVLPNVICRQRLQMQAQVPVSDSWFERPGIFLCGVGKLTANKGFHRLVQIHHALRQQGIALNTCILGSGPEEKRLRRQIRQLGVEDSFRLLGYQENPYRYMAKCQIFVCASHSEGYSTATAEAMSLGLAVCAVRVSGMAQLLGEEGQYGILTENTTQALYQNLLRLLTEPSVLAHYRRQALLGAGRFCPEQAVAATEKVLEEMCL